MNFTGERPTLENKEEIKVSRTRYLSILPFCINKEITDLGCGIGHGSFFLSYHTTKNVTGYDICEEAISEAKQLFIRNNLIFKNLNSIEDLNLDNIDLITMVEFIEHLQHDEALDFLHRCSKINAIEIAITTPNGDQFSYHPKNPSEYHGFHKWHYTLNELLEICNMFKFGKVYADIFDPQINAFTSYITITSNNIRIP